MRFLMEASAGRPFANSKQGSGVRAPGSRLKGRGFESPLEQREMLFSGEFLLLCWLIVCVPPSCYAAVARKRSRHSAENAGGWLRLNTHAPYMWLRMKSLDTKLVLGCVVHQPCNNQIAGSVHHLDGYIYIVIKGYSHSFRMTCDISAVSAKEQRTAQWNSDQ